MKNRLFVFLMLLLSIQAYGQNCTLSVTITQSAPSICSGYSVTLTAATSGGAAPFTFVWSTGDTSPTINVDKAGTYTVTVTDKTPGCTPVKQSATVTVTTTPNAPTAQGVIVCANTSATLTATAPGGTYQWYDAATGGNFLASGATFVTPAITSNTIFYVQTTVGGCTSPRTPVAVLLSGNPIAQGVTICSGNVATLTAIAGDTYTWYDAPNGTVLGTGASFTTPVLTTSTTYFVQSTSKTGCVSQYTPVPVTVTAAPQAPVAPGLTICTGTSADLHASAPAGIFNWYSSPSGGTPLISSPDYTTPPLLADETFYVSTSINSCESPRTPVTVIVTQHPPPPTPQSDTACYKSSITLQASGSGAVTYLWYDAPAGGNLLATGPAYTTPVLNNSTTYYLQANNGGCMSAVSPVNVIVRQQLPPPTAAGDIVCYGSAAMLTASSSGGGTYQWYNAAAGGTLLATGQQYTTPPLKATTTYYVQNTQSGCISPRAAVKVTVLSILQPPKAANATVCSGDSVVLTASGSAGGYAWYDSAAGGNLLSSAQVFVSPDLANSVTYYVVSTVNGCESGRTAVHVTVNPTPTPPVISGNTICKGMAATLTATGATGTVKWYDAAFNGKLLATGNTFKTPVLKVNTTYYVESIMGKCASAIMPVTVTISSAPQFEYSSGTYCISSPNPVPVINDPGGTFSAAPAGLVFVSNKTGEINISASIPGRYTITFSGGGACTVPASAGIFIATSTDAGFSYNSPVCQNGADPLPAFTGVGSGGNFTATPAGLVFIDKSTGEIDLANSAPGTYTITNTIKAAGACPAATATSMITINPGVIVNAGPDQTVASGTPVQLAGSITGTVNNGTWSGGKGSFSSNSSPTAIYTPGAGETVAKLTLTSANPPGPCGPVSATMTITFSNQPANPTVQNVTDCSGSSATLAATAPGGTYQWYDAAAGGHLLATGPTFTTQPLLAAGTYYVETMLNGLTSGRTKVTVSINAVPAAPTAPGVQVCTGAQATLTATGSAGTYAWYDAANGGQLLSTTSTFTTPVLTANASYYVQSEVNGCISARTKVDVLVSPEPNITSAATGAVCSGQPLGYTITADIAAATFNWSRAKVAGISNPAAINQSSSAITETLVNTSAKPVNVTYVITASAGACAGPPFNYVVTVFPAPAVTSPATATICNSSTDNYAITFNVPVTGLSWSRPAVPGISNLPVSGQTATTIKEVLFNTSDAPIVVNYIINFTTATCPGAPFDLAITVNPEVKITSPDAGIACTGVAQDYEITSNVQAAKFVWSRNAVAGISNPAVSNKTSGTIAETLINTTLNPVPVVYDITPMFNGCTGAAFKYTATVNPRLQVPVANSNSPVCLGDTIHLSTPPVPGATYLWTGPNGYTSTLQNPDIINATLAGAGTYTLVFTSNGCNSVPVSAAVSVDQPPVANAGPDEVVCIANPSILLAGSVTGGTTTGIWTTAGTGTFVPSNNSLNAQYLPTAADKAAGSVELTLTSTSKDNCVVSTSTMTVRFGPLPAVSAGPGQEVCSQSTNIPLAGTISIPGGGTWTTSGTGTFSPSAMQLNASYVPSAADVKNGAVTLKLTANNPGVCFIPTDSMKITFAPPPNVYAGGTRYVLKDHTITLNPTVSDPNVHYLWSPDLDINDDTLKNPVITGDIDRTYTLTVTDSRGCISQDTAMIIVSPLIKIDNTFTPNGDGINDYWVIKGLLAYPDVTVDIFDRWGQKVFHSLSYPRPWDGTFEGKPVPVGVYYYVINTHINGQVFSGYVTVIR